MHVFSSSDLAMMKDLTYQRIPHNALIEMQSVLLQYKKSVSKDEAEKIVDEELRKLVDNFHVTTDKYMAAFQQLANKMTSELKPSISQPSKEDEMTFWQWTAETSMDVCSYHIVDNCISVGYSWNSFRVLLCFALVFAVLLAIIGTLGGRHGMSMKILDRFVSLSYAFISMLMLEVSELRLFLAIMVCVTYKLKLSKMSNSFQTCVKDRLHVLTPASSGDVTGCDGF
eukprot:gene17177-19685_t